MIHLFGKTVFGGKVSGTAYVLEQNNAVDIGNNPVDTSEELNHLKEAVSSVKEDIISGMEKAQSETVKEIFEVHAMMLEDDDFSDFLINSVKNDGKTAREAVSLGEKCFSQMFLDTGDDYLIARIDDIRDICGRLTAFLSEKENSYNPQKPFILVADVLYPSTLMNFKSDDIVGIVTASGSLYSHTSILIREMAIPAIICDSVDDIKSGMNVFLNADGGEVFFDSDSKTEELSAQKGQSIDSKLHVFSYKNLPYDVYVNIANLKEIDSELMKKCDGIGLLRTEYMYVGRNELPSEDEQFFVYKSILEKAKGKPVTVRTFDIGSDKSAKTLPLKNEENPALGYRGLRVYSLYPDVFKTQIRALLRASVYGNLSIMFPMVTTCREIVKIKTIVSDIANELSEKEIEYKMPLQGAMIETPAAAVLSSELAEIVDFFSVGTNDLTQYTYALDRGAVDISRFYDESHNAVLSLIKIATSNAHKNGIKIGICGELASNPVFFEKWAEIGIDYISVSRSVL